MKRKILRNAVKCTNCDTVIESKHRHDFVWCNCREIFTDGGTDYLRRGGNPKYMEDVSEFEPNEV